MTDLVETVRIYCRNPKCRMRLPEPTANLREAFCTKGCHSSFYLHRCIVCEKAMPRNSESQLTCYRKECKSAWRKKTVYSRFLGLDSAPVSTPPISSVKPGLPGGDKAGRAWRIVAGPGLSPVDLHYATLSADPPRRQRLTVTETIGEYFTEPDWREVVGPDGVRCFVTQFRQIKPVARERLPIPDDLSIPDFLRRAPINVDQNDPRP